jgi:hypothetical protein
MSNEDFERQVAEYSQSNREESIRRGSKSAYYTDVDRVVHEQSVECASISASSCGH